MSSAAKPRGQAVIYAAPPGVGTTTRIVRSPRYALKVNGQECFVCDTRFDNPAHDHDTACHFACFDFTGTVKVEITVADTDLTSAIVRPLAKRVAAAVDGRTISFSLSEPCKLCIEPNGERHGPLFLLAGAPDPCPPQADDPNVIYLGPGLHRQHISVPSGKTLYLAGGAVLAGSVSIIDAENVAVRGRGIIDLFDPSFDRPDGFMEGQPEPGMRPLLVKNSRNVRVEGVTAVNGVRSWSVLVRDSRDVSFEDCMILGGRWWNSDGIHFQHVLGARVHDCFVRSDDDSFAVTCGREPLSEDIDISHCVTYTSASNMMAVSWRGGTWGASLRRLRLADVDLIRTSAMPQWTWVKFGIMRWSNFDKPGAVLEEIRLEDLRVEDTNCLFQLVWVGRAKNILFKNIDVLHQRLDPVPSELSAQWEGLTGTIDGVTFENVRVNGRPIASAEELGLAVGPGVKNLRFLVSPDPSRP